MNKIHNPNNPVILFIPEAGVYPYLRGLAVLGDAVQKQGGRVLITRDTGQMLRSPIMAMYRTEAHPSEKEKKRINKANDRILKSALKKYQFGTIELSDFIDDRLMKEIDGLVKVPDQELENLKFMGFAVGKIAQYDFILETKSPHFLASEVQKTLYVTYIKNTALAVAVTDKICRQYHPSLLLTFNEYAQCQAVRYGARMNGVPRMSMTYPVHFGIDTSRFLINESAIGYFFYPHCQRWNMIKDTPILAKFVKECWRDSVFRLFGAGGTHIFSKRKEGDPAGIFKKLDLDPKKRTLIAYTSSSDERYGMDILMKSWAEGLPITDAFPDQIAWLSMLRDFAAKRNDIQIVARIHPREGARQFGFDSPHLKKLKETFGKDDPNFRIVWPDDPISSYDLMEFADLCLVSWSNVGLEAARLGIPVLAGTGNMSYPDDDFIQVATTEVEYEKKLNAMLAMDYRWEHLVKAVRLYHWSTFALSLDLSETIPRDIMDDTIWPSAPAAKIKTINDILSGKVNVIEYNLEQWRLALPKDAWMSESEAIRRGIRYFLDKTFYPPTIHGKEIVLLLRIYRKTRKVILHLFGRKAFVKNSTEYDRPDYRLEFVTNPSNLEILRQKTVTDKNLRIVAADGLNAIFIHDGQLTRRMSPMVIKLAKLHADSDTIS